MQLVTSHPALFTHRGHTSYWRFSPPYSFCSLSCSIFIMGVPLESERPSSWLSELVLFLTAAHAHSPAKPRSGMEKPSLTFNWTPRAADSASRLACVSHWSLRVAMCVAAACRASYHLPFSACVYSSEEICVGIAFPITVCRLISASQHSRVSRVVCISMGLISEK